jgi:hypothetical protein
MAGTAPSTPRVSASRARYLGTRYLGTWARYFVNHRDCRLENRHAALCTRLLQNLKYINLAHSKDRTAPTDCINSPLVASLPGSPASQPTSARPQRQVTLSHRHPAFDRLCLRVIQSHPHQPSYSTVQHKSMRHVSRRPIVLVHNLVARNRNLRMMATASRSYNVRR